MPDPQPRKPRWSQVPDEPARKPSPAAKPSLPPAAKPLPVSPPPKPLRPPSLPPIPVSLPVTPVPDPPPAKVDEPRQLPDWRATLQAIRAKLPVIRATLRDCLAIPGVPFALALIVFSVSPVIGYRLFGPARELNLVRGHETQPATNEPRTIDSNPKPPTTVENKPPTIDPVSPPANPPVRNPPILPSLPPIQIEIPTDLSPAPQPRVEVKPPAPAPPPREKARNVEWKAAELAGLYEPLRKNHVTGIPVPLDEVLEDLGRKSGFEFRLDERAKAELRLLPLTPVPLPSEQNSVRNRLRELRAITKLVWLPMRAGNKIEILLTSERLAPAVTVLYPIKQLAPHTQPPYPVETVISQVAAPESWRREAARCTVVVDNFGSGLVSVQAPWSVHDEIQTFLEVVNGFRDKGDRALEHALALKLQPFNIQVTSSDASLRLDSIVVEKGERSFGAEQFELLDLFPGLKRLTILDAPIDGTGIGRLECARKLERLNLSRSAITDAGLKSLQDLPNLMLVNVSQTKVTDAGLAALPSLPRLIQLDLSNTAVTDGGMETVSRCPELAILHLFGVNVTDRSVDLFARMPKLRFLFLNDTKIGNPTLERLATLRSQVQVLYLRRTAVDREGLVHLAKLQNLQSLTLGAPHYKAADYAPLADCKRIRNLSLGHCTVDAELLAHLKSLPLQSLTLDDSSLPQPADLATLPALSSLHLRSTPVTNEGLEALAKLPLLLSITLEGRTGVTAAKVTELKRANPLLKLEIIAGQSAAPDPK